MTELLSPAGSLKSLERAVDAGADAVYIGGERFGARAYADNPDSAGLIEGIEYCHLRGRKIYLTVNTLLKDEEIKGELASFLDPLVEHGLDAVLVQDFGVLCFLKERYPNLKLHASTQMSVTTKEGASWLLAHGICRVVPARELTLSEVREIVQTGIETEVFIHGAMCYSYSGRCLFSSMLGARSGNRGRCAQPCRLPYQDGKFLLSMKDMCTLDLIPDLMDAGISSFKIEGRMKSSTYTAGVTSVYRKYMDLYEEKGRSGYQIKEEDLQLLLDLFNRGGFSSGYYTKKNGPEMVEIRRESPNRKRPGILISEENSKVKINGELRINLNSPVILEVWIAGRNKGEKGSVCVKSDVPSKAINVSLTKKDARRQIEKTGTTPFVFSSLDIFLQEGVFLPVACLNDLRRRALEELKEEILKETNQSIKDGKIMEPVFYPEGEKSTAEVPPLFTVLVTLSGQLEAVIAWLSSKEREEKEELLDVVYLDSNLLSMNRDLSKSCENLEEAVKFLHECGISCFFNFPPILRKEGEEILENPCVRRLLDLMDGFLVQSVDELAYLKKNKKNAVIAADDCLYSLNKLACSFWKNEGVTRITYPAELTCSEMRALNESDAELVLYGHQALMQSAQCLKKTTTGCSNISGISMLMDRKNIRFPVLNRCRFCTNTIYNSVPLNLTGCAKEIQALAPLYLRLSFTVETKEETRELLHLYLRRKPLEGGPEGTRGHFKRGVE